MTKTWSDYAQVSVADKPQVYTDEPVRGMSDEEELHRIAESMGIHGTGEVLYSYEDDARELGIINE